MSSMSISGSQTFGGMSGVGGMRPPPPGGSGRGPGGMQALAESVSSVLDLSTDEITSALQQGKSLDDLAEAQGVSHADLISALKEGLPEDLASSSDVDEVLEAIASRSGAPQRPSGVQGPPPPPPAGGADATSGDGSSVRSSGYGSAARVGDLRGSVSGILGTSLTQSQAKTLDTLSQMLGTDPASLVDSLRSGTSLADLVADKGLDSSSLAAVIQDGLLVDTRS